MKIIRFSNDYTPDWKTVQAAAVERVEHRCIRCFHPYRKGDALEWSRNNLEPDCFFIVSV